MQIDVECIQIINVDNCLLYKFNLDFLENQLTFI